LRINRQIRAPEVRVVGPEGEMLGVMAPRDALLKAQEFGLDLVEVSPNVAPPVCKILDYGKYKYEEQKKKKEAKKKQKIIEIKEIKLRPMIGIHDLEIKIRMMREFITEGDKVKVTMRFRGREMANQKVGIDVLNKVQADLADVGKAESPPRMEMGGQMLLMMVPK
jgi:translation initiation factor IF-3